MPPVGDSHAVIDQYGLRVAQRHGDTDRHAHGDTDRHAHGHGHGVIDRHDHAVAELFTVSFGNGSEPDRLTHPGADADARADGPSGDGLRW